MGFMEIDYESLHNIGGTSGGTDIPPVEELVDNYVVSSNGNLNAGDLCEFINGQVMRTYKAQDINVPTKVTATNTNSYVRPIALSDGKALLLYTTSATQMWASILTITGNTVAVGTPVFVANTDVGCVAITLLDPTHVLIGFEAVSANFDLKTCVITVVGSTITVGSINQTVADYYSSTVSSAMFTQLSATSVLLTYENTSRGLCGAVLTVSGNTVSIGTIQGFDGTQSTRRLMASKIDSTRVLVAYVWIGSPNNYIYGRVLSISGTTVTAGTATTIVYGASYFQFMTLDVVAGGVCGLVTYDGATGYLYSTPFTITGTTVSSTGFAKLTSSTTCTKMSSVPLDSTKTVISYSSGGYLYSSVVAVATDASITAYSECTTSVQYPTNMYGCLIGAGKILLSYDVQDGYMWIKILNSTTSGNGVTSTTVTTHATTPLGLATASATIGSTTTIGIKGVFGGLSGLTPSTTYYCDDNGLLTTTVTSFKIGVALSATELLIKKAFWDRGL